MFFILKSPNAEHLLSEMLVGDANADADGNLVPAAEIDMRENEDIDREGDGRLTVSYHTDNTIARYYS